MPAGMGGAGCACWRGPVGCEAALAPPNPIISLSDIRMRESAGQGGGGGWGWTPHVRAGGHRAVSGEGKVSPDPDQNINAWNCAREVMPGCGGPMATPAAGGYWPYIQVGRRCSDAPTDACEVSRLGHAGRGNPACMT